MNLMTSGTAIAAINPTTEGLSVIDLSGTTPAMANYTLPIAAQAPVFAAVSPTQWTIGNEWGVLLDGASLGGTARYFDYGAVWSIAGSTGSVAVATASGRIVYFDASTLTQQGVVAFPASRVLLSSDGSLLAAAGDQNDAQYQDDRSIRIYSLPGAGLLYTWPYSFSGGAFPQDVELSGSGAVLGQNIVTPGMGGSFSYTQEAAPATGGSAIFSSTGTIASGYAPPIRISPDGTLIAASTDQFQTPNAQTNIVQNGAALTSVTGIPAGWIDDGHLLVDIYAPNPANVQNIVYSGCSVDSPSGQSTGSCNLPEVRVFQTVTSDTIYSPNLAEILSVSSGDAS